jgi:hypothetical protein
MAAPDMHTYLNHTFDKGFLLDANDVRKIIDICKKRIAEAAISTPLVFEINRSDSMRYETEDHEIVLAEENAKRNRIERFAISCNGATLKLMLGFEREKGIGLTIQSYNRDLGSLLFTDIKDYLIAEVLLFRKRSFDSMFSDKLFMPVFALMPLFALSILRNDTIDSSKLAALLKSSVDDKLNFLVTEKASVTPFFSKWAIILPFVAIILLFALGPILDRFFPRNVFEWGKEADSYARLTDRRQKFGWGVIAAFLVGVGASVVAGWIPTPFQK